MNDGISVSEACTIAPESLTAEQQAHCRSQQPSYNYMYIGFASMSLLLLVVSIIYTMKKKKQVK